MRVKNLDIARLLLEAGADVHQRLTRERGAGQRGDTILMDAIGLYSHHKDLSAIRLLLDFGANPNDANEDRYDEDCERYSGKCDWQGSSALTFAASRGLHDVARLLLERGADPTWKRSDGRTAFEVAEKHGRARTAALLKQYLSRAAKR
jgi:ankyrin repeat protein